MPSAAGSGKEHVKSRNYPRQEFDSPQSFQEMDNRQALFRPGMFVSVRLKVQRPGTLLVSLAAVYRTNDERPYVVRVENGRTSRT